MNSPAIISEFFSAVLPTNGYFVAVRKTNGKMKQTPYLQKEGLINYLTNYALDSSFDCWFALASFKQGWHLVGDKKRLRTQANADKVKALWLDIDVGEGKDYATREEAVLALKEFKNKLKFPKPYVVASGSKGLHIYFAFTKEIDAVAWKELASKFKSACDELGFKADPARTADVASILRLPNTWNTKTNPAHQVKILVLGDKLPYEEYKSRLEGFKSLSKKKSIKDIPLPDVSHFTPLEINLDTKAYMKEYFTLQNLEHLKTDPLIIIKGCEQIRNQKDAPEPVWRGMLATMRHTKFGRRVAHKLSALDKRYNPADTDEKLDYLEANDIAPYTCLTFSKLRPETCKNCPFFGMLNSPIGIAKLKKNELGQTNKQQSISDLTQPISNQVCQSVKIDTALISQSEEENITVEETSQENLQEISQVIDNTEETPIADVKTLPVEIPDFKGKAVRVNREGCFLKFTNAEGDAEWRNIYPYPVYPLQKVRGRNPSTGDLQYSYIFRKHHLRGYDDIQLLGSTIMGGSLGAALGDFGFFLKDKERKVMASYLIDILKESDATLGEVETVDKLGWNEAQTHFLLGNKLYKTDGKVFEISVSGKAKPYCSLTSPQGDLEVWKKIANVYNKKGLEWGQAVIASAFASPLMPLGALEKAALLFITGEKGIGKSTALWLGASVYGNPDKMVFNKMDTYNSRIHKLGIYSNISAMFDEMTDMSPKEASDFAYTLTQGRGKDRMSQGGEGLLENTTFWSCLPVMSANDSILNALSQHSADASAQMSRVLEVKATDINDYYSAEELKANERLIRQMNNNYGLAGDIYIRYITSHKAEVLKLIEKTEDIVRSKLKLNSNYRFWHYMITRIIAGNIIANKLGLISYDAGNLLDFLLNIVKRSLSIVEEYVVDKNSMFSVFLANQISNRLVVKYKKRPLDMGDDIEAGDANDIGYVIQKPYAGREITMRLELDTCTCAISDEAIKNWCKEKKIARTEFTSHIKKFVGRQNYKASTRDLGAGTIFRGSGNQKVLLVQFPRSHFLDVFGEELTELNNVNNDLVETKNE